jgi:hypothetical protein
MRMMGWCTAALSKQKPSRLSFRRLAECHLEMHPAKTKVVYCKDEHRQGKYPNVKFDFLGYSAPQKCGRSLQSPWPVLFHDMDKDIMVQAGDPLLDEPDSEDSEELEDALSGVGDAMLKVEDPIVAARVLVALDTSELPEQVMARDPALSGRDVNAEAFRILYKELTGDPRNDPPAPPTSQPDLSCTKCGARVQESSSF